MTVFAILLPEPQPALKEAILASFADAYILSDTQLLVSSSLTVHDISTKVKIFDVKNPQNVSLGNAVIFATSSYFGKMPATLWDWLRVKLETQQSG